MGNFQSVIWATDDNEDVRYSLAIIMGLYVVGLVVLLMVMQILALAFPYRWYLKLFWFEDRLSFYFTRKTIIADRPLAIYYEVLAIAMSLISCGLFIYLTVEVSLDNTDIFKEGWVIYLELGMSIFAIFDYILHFFLAETKIKHIMDPLALCDLVAAFPGLIAPGIGRFLYAFQFLRFLRVLRALLLLESYGFAPRLWRFRASALFMRLFTLALAFVCFVFVMAGFMWISENSHQNSEGMLDNFLDACYLIIVTISTVGYGDFSPKSPIGKVAIMIIIIVAIALVPFVVNILLTAWNHYNADRQYSTTRSRSFVLMLGGTSKLVNFAKEFYNEKRDKYPRAHVVVMSNSEVTPAVGTFVRKPFFRNRLRLYTGDPTSSYHLGRMKLKKTEACFIVPPERHNSVEEEDTEVVMTALAVKSVSPQTRVFAIVFDSTNRMLLSEAGVEVSLGTDELKLTLLAQNCLCPGLSTLFVNLMHDHNWSDGFTHSWERKYAFGSNHEVYTASIPECLVGRVFSEAALVIYHFTNGEVLLLGVKGGSVWNHRKKLLLNPQPRYKLLSGDTAFTICSEQSHADRILNLTPDAVRRCMEGIGDLIRNIEKKRDCVSEEEEASNDSVPSTRNNSRARNDAVALDRVQDEEHTDIQHGPPDAFDSMERGNLEREADDDTAPRPRRRKIPIVRSPESRSLMNLIGHADKEVLMKLIKEEEEAAGGDLNKSVGSPTLHASGQVSPRRRASPRRKNESDRESESESENENEEESEDGTNPARTRKHVRIMDVDSDEGFRPQPEDAKSERGKSEDEEAARRYAEDDNDDDYEVLHGGDVARMPLAQKKRSKSTGLLNALGKRAGANRVDLSDDNVLALLPVPPERTSTFQPIASIAGVPRRKKINLLEQSQAQFSHVVRQDTPTNSNHRTSAEMAELSVADIEVVDVRELGWAGHIVVCGCLRGIAQFIAPLRELHIRSPKVIVVMVPFGQLDDRAYPPSRLFGALRQYKQVYVLSYEAPITRDDFRRAGAETAANVIILDQWSGKDSDKKKDVEGIIMYRLLAGLKLAGAPLISLDAHSAQTASSIHYISPRSENNETREKWFRSELYASGGAVLSESQDTIMCQTFRMPEMADFIRSISRGIVLQLNVTTLTPFAKGMLYRDFLCLVVSTTDLIPLGLYRTDKETTLTSKSGLSALAELMRNSGAALHEGEDGRGNAHMRNRKGKLRKTQAFQENESENENENGKENETACNGSLGSGSGSGGKRGRLLASFERGSKRGKREADEEREFKYVLTHPPWDCRLQESDRVFLLLSDSETWERMRRKDESQEPHEVVRSATPAERKIIEEQILQRLKGEKRKKREVKQSLKEIAKKEKEDKERHDRLRFVPWRKASARPWHSRKHKNRDVTDDKKSDDDVNGMFGVGHHEAVEMTTVREVADGDDDGEDHGGDEEEEQQRPDGIGSSDQSSESESESL